ncbi:Crp/Fnr family transcriptional regulator [Rhodobacter capsulatus]|uniref:Crp/Fnr family transcriptional regulator n=1 Tax=Rhodobacter capsulatus TaxID=1061 RepID=UPI00402904A2
MPPPPPASSDWISRLEGGLRRRYGAGEMIARPDAPSDRLILIESGTVRLSLTGAGREVTLAHLRAGGLFVTHTRVWVEAVEPAQVLSWPVAEMLELVTRHPELGVAAFREVGQILRGALDLIEDLAFRPVEARLARHLLTELQAQGRDTIRLVGPTEALATALGTTRQTLSTLINRLIREGVLSRPGRQLICVHDPGHLARLAEVSSS